MVVKKVCYSPDADAVAVFSLGDQRHVLLKNSLRRRQGRTAVALQRFLGGKVLRPNFPRHDEGHTDFGFVRPFYRFSSAHVFSSLCDFFVSRGFSLRVHRKHWLTRSARNEFSLS